MSNKKKNEFSDELNTDAMVVEEEIIESVEVSEEKEKLYGVVTAAMLNVRENPIATSNPIHILKKGEEVEIDSDFLSPEWFKISTNSNIKGYVMRKFVEKR